MAAAAPPLPVTQPCPSCGIEQSAPWLFCAHCGASRLHLGRWRITLNFSLAFAALLGTYYFQQRLDWNWPLFLLYAALLLQLMLFLAAGRFGFAVRIIGWFVGWMAIAVGAWTLHHKEMLDLVVQSIQLAPGMAVDAALNYPLVFYPCALIVLVILFLPAYLRWGRLYGWVNAYRVLLLTWLAAVVGIVLLLRGAGVAHAKGLLPGLEPFLGEMVRDTQTTAHALGIIAIVFIRLFLLELCIHAALRGYGQARQIQTSPQAAANESGLIRAMLPMLALLRQVGHTLELMALYLIETTRKLARDLAEVLVAFCRELLLPAVAMLLIGWWLHTLAESTRAYLDENAFTYFLRAALAAIGCLGAALLFMACKSRLGFGRLGAYYAQLVGWLLPNALVFFLLLSLSLWGTSLVLNTPDHDMLPFRIGALTIADGVLLAGLLVFVLLRRRTMQPAAEAAHGPQAVVKPEADDNVPEEPIKQPAKPTPAPIEREKPGLLARATNVLAPLAVREQLARAKSTVHDLKEMAAGKPAILGNVARLRAAHEQKTAELAALEALRTTLEPETFEQMRLTLKSEAEGTRHELTRAEVALHQQYELAQREIAQLEVKAADLQRRLGEAELMKSTGVLEKVAREQVQKARLELEVVETRLEQKRQTAAWLATEAPRRPSAAN